MATFTIAPALLKLVYLLVNNPVFQLEPYGRQKKQAERKKERKKVPFCFWEKKPKNERTKKKDMM